MKPAVKKLTCSIFALLALCSCAFATPLHAPQASADEPTESRYYDATAVTPRTALATISYTSKDETSIRFPYAVPYYYTNTSTYPNACGPVAGSIIIGYYDKTYEELIPNYTTYYTASGRYRMMDSTYIPGVIGDLYTRMRTNVDDLGVSESDCLNGLSAYAQAAGRTMTYTSVKNGSSMNHTLCSSTLNAGTPLLLFCNTVTLYAIDETDNQDVWTALQSSSDHVVVAFGYRTIRYYNASNALIRTDYHIEVATGWPTNKSGYLYANDISWLNSGYAANIA